MPHWPAPVSLVHIPPVGAITYPGNGNRGQPPILSYRDDTLVGIPAQVRDVDGGTQQTTTSARPLSQDVHSRCPPLRCTRLHESCSSFYHSYKEYISRTQRRRINKQHHPALRYVSEHTRTTT